MHYSLSIKTWRRAFHFHVLTIQLDNNNFAIKKIECKTQSIIKFKTGAKQGLLRRYVYLLLIY